MGTHHKYIYIYIAEDIGAWEHIINTYIYILLRTLGHGIHIINTYTYIYIAEDIGANGNTSWISNTYICHTIA